MPLTHFGFGNLLDENRNLRDSHLAGKDAGHVVAGLWIGFDLLQECFPCLKDGQVAGGSARHSVRFLATEFRWENRLGHLPFFA